LKKIILVFMLMLADMTCAQTSIPAEFRSVFARHDVALGTNPHIPFWQEAIPTFAELDNFGHPVPLHRTEVRSRWTEHNLYLLFICPYEELNLRPHPSITTETNELWNWDVAELFIGSDWQNIRRYKEFEVSPQAEWVDLDINLDLPDHTVGWTWNSGMHVAARIDESAKIWYAAMVIPMAAIDSKPPRAGAAYRANLYRSQGPEERRRSITWRPPMKETFHTPESFGKLVLVEK
jgi:hypothetical protein